MEKTAGQHPVSIIGSYLSPYVRKVLACLELKGVAYCVDPVVPFYGDEEFARLSPLRRIPVLMHGDVVLCDSTVICEYLDERWPQPALFPSSTAERARARWLEEFADTRMGEVFIWHYFNQLVIRRFVWREEPDAAVLARATEEEIPAVLDYLEGQLPRQDFIFGSVCVADIAIATFFRNAGFAGFAIDAQRWPGTSAYVERVLALPCFMALRAYEELSLRTPIPRVRDALQRAGAPLTERSCGTDSPRRGVLSI